MITLQSRGENFEKTSLDGGGWVPIILNIDIFEEMRVSLKIPKESLTGMAYLTTLAEEGSAFRQRIVDYQPPEDSDA